MGLGQDQGTGGSVWVDAEGARYPRAALLWFLFPFAVPAQLACRLPARCLQVVLVANSLPAINDVTAAELRSVSALRDHAVLLPTLAASHQFCACARSALLISDGVLLIADSILAS